MTTPWTASAATRARLGCAVAAVAFATVFTYSGGECNLQPRKIRLYLVPLTLGHFISVCCPVTEVTYLFKL